jgi:signal transduction histidine kinase
VVRTVGKGLARRAERAGSRLTVNAEAPAVGQWDRSQLEKMVSNLLDNAIKFGAGQPIEVTVRTDGGRMLLTVRDRGIGISGEHLESIFQRYSRGVSAKNFGGLGLGLYLVRVIAEAHGGTVRAESCPGAGATFTVELPLPQPAVAPALVPRASA